MATIRQFKNGRIKDPVARRVEERRLQRLRGIKSSVKSRGLNKSKRASMRRLDRRQHTNSTNDLGNLSMPPPRRSGINDVTNDSQWQGLHDSASELLKRAQKHAARTSQRSKIQSLQDEFDEQSESADENVLDASFDTLWNFHAQKNNLTSGDGDGDGDLEDAATTLIAPLGSGSGSSGSGSGNGGGTQTARSESVQSEGGKSTKSVKLDDAAAEAFQNAWSAATPIGLHDDALDDSRVEGTNSHHPGLFGDERKHKIKKSKARTKRGRKQMDLTGVKGGQRPSLSKMERGWKSRGLPTSAASLRDTVRDCRQSPREADEEDEDEDEDEEGERERERERDHHDAENHNLTTAMQQPTLLTFDILKRKRREESRLREENQVLLNRLADVNGDGDGVIDMDAMMNGDMDEDLSEFQDLNEGDRVEQQQYSQQKTRMKKGRNNKGASGSNNNSPLLPMPPLAASKSRTNLFRSNGVSGTKVPHYSTRTKTNLAKTLKPMIRKKIHEDDRDEDKGARGSWRGGGSADPHAQSERERVLEVKKREQKQAREAARNWRKRTEAHRRKQEEKAATAVGSTSPTAPAAKATKSPSPSKRNPGTIQTLQNEKNEAQAMLAELMSTEADTKMDEQLHTHRNEEEREEEEEETQTETETETETQHDVNSLIPTPLKNSQKYNYMDRDLHLDSPMDDAAVEAEDSPFLQRQDDTEGPESNTPEKDNINNVQDIEEEDGRGSVSFSVPQLDLGDVSPDIQETSDDEEEEDDALFD